MARKASEEGGDKRLKVGSGIDRVRASLADAAKGVGSGIPDMDVRIFHHANQNGQSLLDEGIQHLLLRTFHDSTECGDGSITEVPVFRAQVLLNKGKD